MICGTLVGEVQSRLRRHRRADLDIGDFDGLRGESRRIRLIDARGRETADLDADRRLRRRLRGEVGDLDGAAQQVERDLAAARFAARRTNLLKRGVDLVSYSMLRIELKTEETSHPDYDGGNQAAQNFHHSVSSGCRLSGGQLAVVGRMTGPAKGHATG